MELVDRVVVVTGGGSGIGQGLVPRFLHEGAKGVVVVDRDEQGALRTAALDPQRTLALACDVSDEQALAGVLEQTRQRFGSIDLFCANAGVAIGTDEQTPEDVWDQAFDVNVRAHVRAARLLLPDWLARGDGYFLCTASAAGLLTQIGSAPYAVTKHAAVAFAEWLSVTYGERGLRVSCLCPMGVNTPMLSGDVTGNEAAATRVVKAAGAVLEVEQVAECVVAGLREERFLILPHAEVLDFYRHKGEDYERWLAGMRRLSALVGP